MNEATTSYRKLPTTLYHPELPKKTLGVPYYPGMTERGGFYRAWDGIFRRGRAAISHLSSSCGKICKGWKLA